MSQQMMELMQNQQAMIAMLAEKAGLLDEGSGKKAMSNIPGVGSQWAQKHTVANLFNEAELPYSELSFFMDCNLMRPIGNLTIQPMAGLLSIIPTRPTSAREVKKGFLTEWDTEQTGELPIQPCDDPQAIDITHNFCKMRFVLGRHDKRTQTMELDALITEACLHNWTDDFYFQGDVRGVSIWPRRAFNPRSRADRDLIQRGAVMKQVQAVMREHQKWLVNTFWNGNPVNNTAGGGYREFVGLTHLINDDYPNDPVLAPYLESESGNLADCEMMNSDCKVFGECIGNPLNDPTMWVLMQELEQYIWLKAFHTGNLPGRWIWVMRPEVWEVLTRHLPCQIAADGCTNVGEVSDNVTLNLDIQNLNLRQEMRSTRRLTINGRTYPVILDSSIPYFATGTETESTIYFIPLSIGGEEVLYMEHLDYRRIASILRPLPNTIGNLLGWTDGGRYHWTINFLRRCFEVMSKLEPRLIFTGSAFAGCITGVRACTLQDRAGFTYWESQGPIPQP